MTSVAEAMRYIEEAVKGASVRELQSLEIAVLGKVRVVLDTPAEPMSSNDPASYAVMSKRNVKDPWVPFAKVGGAESLHPENIDDTDADIARLTELLDAIHDFGNKGPPKDRKGRSVPESEAAKKERLAKNKTVRSKLHASIGAKIPLELSGEERKLDDILERLTDHSFVIDTLTTAKELTFEGRESLPNPWRGRCIEQFVSKDGPGIMKKSGNEVVQCVDMYFKDGRRAKAQIAVVKELAKLRRDMEQFFTTKTSFDILKNMELHFMVDQCMTPRYPEDRSCMLFSWITGFSVMIEALNEYFEIPGDPDGIAGDEITKNGGSTLKQHYCDASMYDGGVFTGDSHVDERTGRVVGNVAADAEFSDTETGRVFRKDGAVQIEFCKPLSVDGYTYKVTTTDPAKNPIPWTSGLAGREDTVVVRDGFIMDRVAPANHSTKVSEGFIVYLQNKGAEYGWAVPAALKRAGDWGQIEHCKRKKLIFVTADRLTALYAAYRDVLLLFVKHATDPVSDTNGDTYAHFSFIMCGSVAARAACCTRTSRLAPAGPSRTWAMMIGGGIRRYGTPMLLGAVVAACAVVSSVVKA
jgi:hypothetical protein